MCCLAHLLNESRMGPPEGHSCPNGTRSAEPVSVEVVFSKVTGAHAGGALLFGCSSMGRVFVRGFVLFSLSSRPSRSSRCFAWAICTLCRFAPLCRLAARVWVICALSLSLSRLVFLSRRAVCIWVTCTVLSLSLSCSGYLYPRFLSLSVCLSVCLFSLSLSLVYMGYL